MKKTISAVALCAAIGGCGDNGTSGPAGPAGEPGEPGMNGSNGTNGTNGTNGVNGAACPVGGGIETETEGVPSSAPLSSLVSFTFCDAAGTGKTNIADYVKALVDQYAKGTIDPKLEFPLSVTATDSVRGIAGLVPDVVVKWLDPLVWDNMVPAGSTTPRFGANADYLAFFGDNWAGTPYWTGSDNAGFMWVNHEYVSNGRPQASAAPTGQHLTLARFLAYWGVIGGAATSNAWSAADLAIYTDEYKKQVGGTWMRIVKDPSTGEWAIDKSTTPVRYDATDSTLIKVTGLDVSDDTDDHGTTLPADVVVGMQGNCSGGVTPWGTIFTAEENVSFSYGDLEAWTSGNRLTAGRGFDPGQNVTFSTAPSASGEFTSGTASHPRDAYGFLVEIDPGVAPGEYFGKTTAGVGHRKVGYMGRANWENAAFAVGADWKLVPNQPIVIYSGNDRRSGHIYKFVTSANYTAGMTKAQIRALLDSGKLYVSHFAGLDNTQGRRLAAGMATPTQAAPGTGQWIELSTASTAIAPNATALGTATKTVGQALQDVSWNSIGGFPTDDHVRKALFTASLKIGAMELNRPEDIEYNPFGGPGGTTPRLFVAFTNHSGTVALDQNGVMLAANATQPNRGDRVGGIFVMEETSPATPGSSTGFKYWQAWQGNVAPGLFAAGSPDNILVDKTGGVWFGTDGYFGTSSKKQSDGVYYLDLDPAHLTTSTPTFGLAFRVASVPSDAEATAPTFTPGMTSMFMNVQHPGEDNYSKLAGAMRALLVVLLIACGRGKAPERAVPVEVANVESTGPLAHAAATMGQVANREAAIPPMCYTRTGGASNPCWVCHTQGVGRTGLDDSNLQEAYAFSEVALTNQWTNLFVDRRPFIAGVTDDEILRWVRMDNYAPLRDAMRAMPASYTGFRPDLDLAAGFDDLGFARDGSGWRALRFQPFLGAFWPSNGSTSDSFIRLPDMFRRDANGKLSTDVYRLNLSIVEAAITIEDPVTGKIDRAIEPVDERLIAFDLDRDGALGFATRVRALPPHYAGAATHVPVVAHAYPHHAELLHSVRYLDPDAPTAMAARMKELRYMRKVLDHDDYGRQRAYEEEAEDKAAGKLPVYQGDPEVGFLTPWGWQLQGYIEDARGALRVQTEEEHRFCMGCHGHIGVTIDQTFSFARKVPGADGWRPQDLRGLKDRPQVGHTETELVTYFTRVRGADETRSNEELLARFFDDGVPTAEIRRAAKDKDLAWALIPSRARALALDKAYLAIVREQSFTKGRDAMLAPATRVHQTITEEGTGMKPIRDGRLHLVW